MTNEYFIDSEKRYELFPIKHQDLFDAYEKLRNSRWLVADIPFADDLDDWNKKLNENEQHFIKHVLAFFAACFTGDTEIVDINGEKIKFKDLPKRIKEQDIYTFSSAPNGDLEVTKIKDAFVSGYVNELVKVYLDNDTFVECTPNHRFMLRDGSYKEAGQLKAGDSLMPNNSEVYVVKVEFISLDTPIPVYDLTVESEHHNFPLANGVFVHNSDGIVNENLAVNMLESVPFMEATCFYNEQLSNETIHAHTYSMLLETLIKDSEEKLKLFKGIETIPAVKKKAEWALNWIDKGDIIDKLLAFSVVEGLLFSGSFCAIYFLKSKKLMPALGEANMYISKDENLHMEFAVHLYKNYVKEDKKKSNQHIKNIIEEALQVEREFVTDALPVSLIGMNADLMNQYLRYVASNLYVMLTDDAPIYNDSNPFPFMEAIALNSKTNFFEKRAVEYQAADVGDIKLTDDF